MGRSSVPLVKAIAVGTWSGHVAPIAGVEKRAELVLLGMLVKIAP
jgi:hypothetical protein